MDATKEAPCMTPESLRDAIMEIAIEAMSFGNDAHTATDHSNALMLLEMQAKSLVKRIKITPPTRKLRCGIRPLKKNDRNEPHIAFGLRVGYWPCIKAPYVSLCFYRWYVELWYGLPSYGGR